MKQIYIIAILSILGNYVHAQIVDGFVRDEATNEPLIGANVTIDGTMLGTSTDTSGYFSIAVEGLPAVLTISYVGYESQKITVQDFKTLNILLNTNNRILPEVVVSDVRPIEEVFEKPFTIKDYAFYDDYIILLVYRNVFKKHSLIVSNEKGEILSETNVKSYHPESLFTGCLGGVHLVGAAFARQIYIQDEEILFMNKIEKRTFLAQLQPCVAANMDYVFYKKQYYRGQLVEYLQIDKKNPENIFSIAQVADEKGIELQGDEEDFQKLKRLVAAEHSAGQPISSAFGDGGVETFQDILYKDIFVPIFEYRNHLFLFDHVHDFLVKMDMSGTVVDHINIEYHKAPKWKKEVIFDEETGKAYTIFDTPWNLSLHEINLKTGEIGDALTLDRPHISHIKIKDGYVYFLYYAPQHGVKVRKLERMWLGK